MSCPICNKPTDPATRPFCSKRCADLDLARWLNGSYAVPSTDPEDIEAAFDALASGEGARRDPDDPDTGSGLH
ncbi:DNA gyrase inhibitor [Oceanicola sp. 22II-s10i]|uniref:DNA gyrase inhibitor YacG n=1 Tax=Oceanicola sp. 22II-s10i TaxID=1317116 RepID=UPI000B52027C|nr:DNA gyrase inhibitor YacG [Oceanicola sp. 22II-s10i]OWU84099.1 DNA gyrase inhibitor [Oceanicola sp. 22II-s10i]